MSYHQKLDTILKRIENFTIDKYKNEYANWKQKLEHTNTYFCILRNNTYQFAPVKYIMSKNNKNHANTNGKVARDKALKLGFSYLEGHVKRAFKIWCKNNKITFKNENRILAYFNDSSIQNHVKKYSQIEKTLQESFVINGNKNLQGEFGEYLIRKIFNAIPCSVNQEGIDLLLPNGKSVEVKTKRPHAFNPSPITVNANKLKSDYIAFIWFDQTYKILHLTIIESKRIQDTMGKRTSYEINPMIHFEDDTLLCMKHFKKIPWKHLVKNKNILSQWITDDSKT
jgi:hypothetical protein